MALRQVPVKRSPYGRRGVASVGFTIGTEASNIINVALQVKKDDGANAAVKSMLKAWLSSDAAGKVVAASPEAIAIGTDGAIFPTEGSRVTGLVNKATLIIDATNAAQFSTSTTATYVINGVTYTKTATVDLTFTAAHVITASTFGVVLVQINAAGTISTKVPAATQAYASAALALAALPAPDAGNVALGYIAIANNTGDWTANTDDLTNASDVTTAAFVDGDQMTSVPVQFDLLSESDGDIDINITDTRVRTYYLNVAMPDGTVNTSGAIAFA